MKEEKKKNNTLLMVSYVVLASASGAMGFAAGILIDESGLVFGSVGMGLLAVILYLYCLVGSTRLVRSIEETMIKNE